MDGTKAISNVEVPVASQLGCKGFAIGTFFTRLRFFVSDIFDEQNLSRLERLGCFLSVTRIRCETNFLPNQL
jgi:hypothetical protein